MKADLIKVSIGFSVLTMFGFAHADNSFYVEGSAGVAMGGSSAAKAQGTNAINQPTSGFDVDSTKGVFGLSLGYYITPSIAIEGSYRYRKNATDTDYLLANPAGNVPTNQIQQDAKVETHSLMVNGKYFFDLPSSKIRPYAKAGIGVVRNKTNSTLDMNPLFSQLGSAGLDNIGNSCKGSVKWCYPSESRTNFAWSIGVGAQYPINDKTYVGLDYQYIDMGKAKTGIDPNGDWLEIKNLRNHELSLTLGHQF